MQSEVVVVADLVLLDNLLLEMVKGFVDSFL
jgi:hypothetical protein